MGSNLDPKVLCTTCCSKSAQHHIHPNMRTQDGLIILTRIDPLNSKTSMLLRVRPGWNELRAFLAGELDRKQRSLGHVLLSVGKVRLHCYVRLQGQLSGNTEACNQTWLSVGNSTTHPHIQALSALLGATNATTLRGAPKWISLPTWMSTCKEIVRTAFKQESI
eukprot:scaffold43193_cov16-Tisochrysis_lutea.AAC.1